jgi:starch synthase
MRVLSVTPEFFPLIKTGGLADVAGALPLALGPLGVEMRTLLPAYRQVWGGIAGPVETVAGLDELFGGPARILAARSAEGAELLLLDAPHLFDRPGNPYLGPDGRDWPDNHRRFAALAWAAHRIGTGLLEPWRPEIVHGHDWQAGLAPAYLSLAGGPRPGTVLTVHNLAFQGVFPAYLLGELRLPASAFAINGLEYFGGIGFLKAGLFYADRLTTVSPTYAREIQTRTHGMGLDGLLRTREAELAGITNGIDTVVWDPSTDLHLAARYDAADPGPGKAANKRALQERLELEPRAEACLFCVISRFTGQKGIDLILDALPEIFAHDAQLAVLGSGDPRLEQAFRAAVLAHPGRVGFVAGYDEPLSHLIQGGADAILVPSRFEPCGLTQLIGLRYGTLPVVARVGGLADTVIDANEAALADGVATGFQLAPVTGEALAEAVARAIGLFRDRAAWQGMVRRAMSRDVGWDRAARHYRDLYAGLLAARD